MNEMQPLCAVLSELTLHFFSPTHCLFFRDASRFQRMQSFYSQYGISAIVNRSIAPAPGTSTNHASTLPFQNRRSLRFHTRNHVAGKIFIRCFLSSQRQRDIFHFIHDHRDTTSFLYPVFFYFLPPARYNNVERICCPLTFCEIFPISHSRGGAVCLLTCRIHILKANFLA